MRKKSGLKINKGLVSNKITLSTGVVLKVQAVASWNFTDLVQQIERPVPPIVVLDGDRKMENPDDPEYQKALRKFEMDVSEKMNDFTIVYGTEIVSIPDSVESMESENWKNKLAWRGKKVGEDPVGIYLSWIKYVAAANREDILMILKEVGRRSGVRKSDVEAAVKNFRRDDTGDAGGEIPAKDGDQD